MKFEPVQMMSTTINDLTKRWSNEWKEEYKKITDSLLHRKSFAALNLPDTEKGLTDLRSYFTPKVYATVKSNSGKDKTFVQESIYIRKQRFENIDFSFSDFEACEFIDCSFRSCLFDKARMRGINFMGCEFEQISFLKTDFGDARFVPSGIFFIEKKSNFTNIGFRICNLSGVNFLKQGFENCFFNDCNTATMSLNTCRLNDLQLTGDLKDAFITSCRVNNFNLTEAFISGISLRKQQLDGFIFPADDTYYIFSERTKELDMLEAANLDEKERQLLEILRKIWTMHDSYAAFIDINYLKPEEIETGKSLLNRLRKAK